MRITAHTSNKARSALVITELGIFSCLVATVYRLIGWDIVYYKGNDGSVSGYKHTMADLLKLRQVDFQTVASVDTGYVYGDLYDTVRNTMKHFWSPAVSDVFRELFVNVEDLNDKLYAINRAFFDYRCRDLAAIATWAVGQPSITSVRVCAPACAIRRQYLKQLPFNIAPAPLSTVYFAAELITRFVGKLVRRGPRSRGWHEETSRGTLPGQVHDLTEHCDEILYFPHKTIAYGRAFLKDQFYADDPSSPFNSANIMHVELEPVSPAYVTPELCGIYQRLNIRYCILPRATSGGVWQALKRIGRSCFSERAFRCVLSGNVLLLFVSAYFYVQFAVYFQRLRRFSNARLALVGYEMLFPKALALALEARGIRTVASQERVVPSTFYRNYNYIVDTLFAASSFVCEQLSKTPDNCVSNCVPVGLVRTDLLVSYVRDAGVVSQHRHNVDARKLIVAYDFESYRRTTQNWRQPIVNWRANREFYEDLLRLAQSVAGIHIVIRGKNANWLSIDYFQETAKRLDACANMEVNADYSRLAISYELAAAADIVIAKHSSIGDECLAIGKDVIFYDYLPNATSTISRAFHYEEIPIFAFSYQELENKVRTIVDGGTYLQDDQRKRLQDIVNGGRADGAVKRRVQRELGGLYAGIAHQETCGPTGRQHQD